MPTKNPRITVTLTSAVHAVLKRISALTGNSQSAIVGDLLAETLPVLERMAKVMEAAQAAKDHTRQEIAAGLERAQARVEEQLGLLVGEADEVLRPLLDDAEKVRRRRGRAARVARGTAAPAPAGPPMSNRGVTPSKHKAKEKA